jgi:hypothetical protein
VCTVEFPSSPYLSAAIKTLTERGKTLEAELRAMLSSSVLVEETLQQINEQVVDIAECSTVQV